MMHKNEDMLLNPKIRVMLLNEDVLDSERYGRNLVNQIIEEWMNKDSYDCCKKVISRIQTLTLLFEDDYDLTKCRCEKFFIEEDEFKSKRRSKYEQRKKDIILYFETEKKSITIRGEVVEIDNDYYKEVIIFKFLPNNRKYAKLKTRNEKLSNDDMELIYNIVKDNFSGRIWRKSISIFELQEDAANYLLEGKITKYDKAFEKNLYKLFKLIDSEGKRCNISIKERIMEIEESGEHLEVLKVRSGKKFKNERKNREVFKKGR
jgi:hypothetical protein